MSKLFIMCFSIGFGYQSSMLSQDLREYPVSSITLENGLPSNETFHVIEDQEGFIWLATDNGLSKYNGSQHKVFDNRHGLPSKSVYRLFLQADTSIVGICSNGELFKIKNDNVEDLIDADSSKKYISPTSYPFSYFQDKNGAHHIGTRKGYFCFDRESNLVKVEKAEQEEFILNLQNTKENSIFCYFDKAPRSKTELQLKLNNKSIGTYPVLVTKSTPLSSIYPSKNDLYTVLHLRSDLFVINNESEEVQQFKLENECIGTYIDKNTLYVLFKKSGIGIYDLSNGDVSFKYQIFSGLSISSVLKSENGIYWVTTLSNGVRKIDLNSPIVVYQGQTDEIITSLFIHAGYPIIGFQNGDVLVPTQNKRLKTPTKVFDITHHNHQLFVSSSSINIFNDSLRNINHRFDHRNFDQIRPHYHIPFDDSISVFLGKSRVIKWNMKSGAFSYPVKGVKKCYSGRKIGAVCYISRFGDVVLYNPLTHDTSSIKTALRIIYFYEHNDQVFGLSDDFRICGIKGRGIDLIDIPYSREMNGIYGATYHNGLLHFSTNIGVYSWSLSESGVPDELINYEPVAFVQKIQYHNDTLYFATKKSVLKKPISSFHIKLPKLKFASIRTDSLEHNVNTQSLILNHDQTNIEIELAHQSYSESFLNYRYSLVGNEKKYFYTIENKITYSSLAPGNYTLRASATSDGINYSNQLALPITVLPPFWKTWWFSTLILSFTVGLILWLSALQIRRIKRKAELKQSISRLKAQALAAQLNPHMVFNVLNSIQGMVSESQIEESNIYISRFSKYLRNTLRLSKQMTCSIEDEIDITRSYLELEKLRFEETIDFEFNISLNDFTIQVPPLIMQPIIENAIKHGAYPAKEKRILINCKENEDFLLLEVSDNGIGISEDYSTGDGLRITQERLNILSPENKLEITSHSDPTTFQMTIKK